MKKFMILYLAGPEAIAKMKDASKEKHMEEMEKWKTWAAQCGDSLVDFGNSFSNSLKLKSGAAGDSGLIMYSILQGENMEAIIDLLRGHPHMELDDSCEISIHECMNMPEM